MINKNALETINDERLADYPKIMDSINMIIRRTSQSGIVVATNKRCFDNWWKEMCLDINTSSAVKYCHAPVFMKKEGVYVIKTIDYDAKDVMDCICYFA